MQDYQVVLYTHAGYFIRMILTLAKIYSEMGEYSVLELKPSHLSENLLLRILKA